MSKQYESSSQTKERRLEKVDAANHLKITEIIGEDNELKKISVYNLNTGELVYYENIEETKEMKEQDYMEKLIQRRHIFPQA